MRLNIAKCATAMMVMGVPRYGSAVTINGEAIPTADIGTPYKYLGVLQFVNRRLYFTQQESFAGTFRYIDPHHKLVMTLLEDHD